VVDCLGSLYVVVGEWINYAASELEITIYLLLDVIAEGPATRHVQQVMPFLKQMTAST